MTVREKWRYCLLGAAIGGLGGSVFVALAMLLTFLLTGILGYPLAAVCACGVSFVVLKRGFGSFRPMTDVWVKKFLASTTWSQQHSVQVDDIVLPDSRAANS